MEGRCTRKKFTLEYPEHRFTPEDLLHFIEATEFTKEWARLGLNDDEDLASLQMCIMANPNGDGGAIDGTGGLRKHCHEFDWAPEKRRVNAYYAYFEDYGIVYLMEVDTEEEEIEFTNMDREAIREALEKVGRVLQGRDVIR